MCMCMCVCVYVYVYVYEYVCLCVFVCVCVLMYVYMYVYGLPPVFIFSLVFNSICYNGEPGRNKKEAEQLVARAVILSHLSIFTL